MIVGEELVIPKRADLIQERGGVIVLFKLRVRIGILFGAVLRFGSRGLTELGLAFLGRAKVHSLDLPPIVFLLFNQLYSPLL